MGARGHDGAVARTEGTLRIAPGCVHPDIAHRPDIELQRAGHADLVETPAGETYMVHLCGRPIRNRGRCILGRETAIQRMVWCEDDWLRTGDRAGVPYLEVAAPSLPEHVFPTAPERKDFDSPHLPLDFQWLRSPLPDELFSLTERPGHLRLYGRETIGSLFHQSLVARRQQAHCFSAETVVEFEPDAFQQMAGLVCYYNGSKFHYLYVSHDAESGKAYPCDVVPARPGTGRRLQRAHRHRRGNSRASAGGDRLRTAVLCVPHRKRRMAAGGGDAGREYSLRRSGRAGTPNFTGAFVGVCCQDLAGTRRPADFNYFEYRERAYHVDPFAGR